MKKYILFFLIIIIQNLYPFNSIFNNRNWKFVKTFDNINLYVIDTQYPCFYKAEIIIDKRYYTAAVKALLDFKNYSTIFPRTMIFEILDEKPGNFLIYSVINFFPLKNRDYYLKGKYFEDIDTNNNKIWTLIWHPVYDEKSIFQKKNREINILKT